MAWQRLGELEISGKRVLTRVDINVPVADGAVTDATRIERVVPTVRLILERGGQPILMSHLGRPAGRTDPQLSLQVVRPDLSRALGQEVVFFPDLPGRLTAESLPAVRRGQALLLENLRFDPGEEANDPAFAARLAALGEVFCNDAFSAAHRSHASTTGLAAILPSCAGLLMQAELEALEGALASPRHPVVAVIGGAKVSTKLGVLENLATRVDFIVVGGGMANTFLAARGLDVGSSICERDMLKAAREIEAAASESGCRIVLPDDVVVAGKLESGTPCRTVAAGECAGGEMILDIGPASVAQVNSLIDSARTLVWNGPLGAFETKPFDVATVAVARHAASRSSGGRLFSVAGGGDTIAALNAAGVAGCFSYLSTAGGAFLEWLEGATLPGVAALEAGGS